MVKHPVATRGPPTAAAHESARPNTERRERAGPPGRRITLNTATAAELETLPRVGPMLARRIIATAGERQHLRRLLETLSPEALIVADAAYMGYELVWAIVPTRRSFLLRMSSKVDFYPTVQVPN